MTLHRTPATRRFRTRPHAAAAVALGVALAVATLSSQAQTTGGSTTTRGSTASGTEGWSLLPWTKRGYIGINVGKPEYNNTCGAVSSLNCDDPDARVHVYTGGMFNEWLGAEIGYLNEGEADRGGGSARAEGVNLSAVGRVPLGQFNVFGKLGATYGQTRVSAVPSSGIVTGKKRGWGQSVALGAGFDFTPSSGVVLEWARHDFKFPSGGKDNIDSVSLGYVHRF